MAGRRHEENVARDLEGTEPLPELPRTTLSTWFRERFLGEQPSVESAFAPLTMLALLLYTRSPRTNFIFDEQEALIANPYVRAVTNPKSPIHWIDVLHRDFWGRLPETTIGSYRPIPNLLWRFLWMIGARDGGAFPHHIVNVLLHGLAGAVLVAFVYRLTREHVVAWLTGALFVATAVVTEAVTGVVGAADVLGGLGALLALLSLGAGIFSMPLLVFLSMTLGLFSKESAVSAVPMVPLAALLFSRELSPRRQLRDLAPEHARLWTYPWRWAPWVRAPLAALSCGAAFVLYVETRRHWFPVPVPEALLPETLAGKSWLARAVGVSLRWYAQPVLPHDPVNNPLEDLSSPLRIAGALRVYLEGLGQVVFPWTLSGDYSAPQEVAPTHVVSAASVVGGVLLVLPVLVALGLLARVLSRRLSRGGAPLRFQYSAYVAFFLLWIVVAYLPVSNIPIPLPTVRAERFWYLPAVGTASLLALVFFKLFDRARSHATRLAALALPTLYLLFQCLAARNHSNDYASDLAFWRATQKSSPNSAKAHLNYGIMEWAHNGDNEARLKETLRAVELSPKWPMGNVYVGDTLCRLHRAQEGVPYYKKGFDLSPGDSGLIALGLQCLWDEGLLADDAPLRDELEDLSESHKGTWLAILVEDLLENGESQGGVAPRYRPRGYDQPPKELD